MILRLFLWPTLFLPILGGSNKTISNDTNILINNTKAEQKVLGTSIMTEGGPTIQSTPLTLSTQDHAISLGREKSMQQSSSSNIVARKGVKYNVENTTEVQIVLKKLNDTQITQEQILAPMHKNISSVAHINTTGINTLQKSATTKANQLTSRSHKPLVLSNEPLDRMKIQNTDINTGMPLDDKSGPSKKIEPMSASRHPGMIMPVVITILVVPMFAMLGYMALRRGQEAWKNRHYKRMDFLLDGMYNE